MWDFGRAELLEPEAIGEPGQRTFRLRVISGSEAASLWLGKERRIAVTLALPPPPPPPPRPAARGGPPQRARRAGRSGIIPQPSACRLQARQAGHRLRREE